MSNPLDNPVWYALKGPLSRFAKGSADGRAVGFMREVSIFNAVERLDAEGWEALSQLVGVGGAVFLFRDEVPAVPAGWKELARVPTQQLVAGDLAPVPELEVARLVEADVSEMVALAKLTEPGPFLPGTPRLGTYVGVRNQGRLVAMAGERFQPTGWTEISAVCTHPDARRKGLAAALSLWMARHIKERGDDVFLHVVEANTQARTLYESIGFVTRRAVEVVGALRTREGA